MLDLGLRVLVAWPHAYPQGTSRIARRRDINPGERAHEAKVGKATEAGESQGWLPSKGLESMTKQKLCWDVCELFIGP